MVVNVKPKYYTKTERHPDDAISEVKDFVNDLQKVQEDYFNNLVRDLNIKFEIEDFLFDYVFNEEKHIELTFTEYIADKGKDYEDFVNG